jgi:hypothetical protein
MFPACRRIAGRQAYAPGPDKFAVSRTALNLSGDFCRPREVIDQHRMSDCRLRRLKRPFLNDCRV